jgi:imidazole glycerol-phosphate synthase subunit HisH
MIAIIDYGASNLRSVVNAVARLGYQAKVTSKAADLYQAQVIILPGVGAGGDTMAGLEKHGLVEPIRKTINEGRPFLAICIGLQVLFTGTEEGGWHDCLGVIPGVVKKLPPGLKIPHMGWNQVRQAIPHFVYQGIPDNTNFYFVHSYYADPDDRSVIAGTTEYGIPFCSVVARGNLVATQFHPEKSGTYGLKIYDNFIKQAVKS